MQIEKRSGADERTILISMILDRVVLSRVNEKWGHDGLFSGQWANLVGGWCVSYFRKFDDVPGKRIQGQYDRWASKDSVDENIATTIGNFLAFLSDESEATERPASDYVLDVASLHFNKVRLRKLIKSVEAELDADEIPAALRMAEEFGKVELASADGVHPFLDRSVVAAAFAEPEENLIKYDGALGKFFDGVFTRNALVSFMAPEKRGKTWWLLDVAYRAMVQRKRVAFFEIGDMSEGQLVRRWYCRTAKLPRKVGAFKIPTSLSKKGKEDLIVEYDEREFDRCLNEEDAWESLERLIQHKIKSKEPYLKLSTHAAGTVNVNGIKSILDTWKHGGWIPDVIVIDYADLLTAQPGSGEKSRDQIDRTWKDLRGLSQTQHCLVLTATQAKAESYSAELLTMAHFSEDKRKLAHVNCMIGINATEAEKAKQVQRLNFIAFREEEYSIAYQVYVGNCFKLGHPSVVSAFRE